jgi:hypothetical protein
MSFFFLTVMLMMWMMMATHCPREYHDMKEVTVEARPNSSGARA